MPLKIVMFGAITVLSKMFIAKMSEGKETIGQHKWQAQSISNFMSAGGVVQNELSDSLFLGSLSGLS